MDIIYLIYNAYNIIVTKDITYVEEYFKTHDKNLFINEIENGKFISQQYIDEEILYCGKYKQINLNTNLYLILEGEVVGQNKEVSLYVTESEDKALDLAIEIFDYIHEDESYHTEKDYNGKRITKRKCRKIFVDTIKKTKAFFNDTLCTREQWFIKIFTLKHDQLPLKIL